jgi:hypothetical protein
LGKEEPIGEEELLAEKGIEEGARETGIAEKNVDAQVATKGWPNKDTPLTKRARAHDT